MLRSVCHNLGCGCAIWQREFDQQSLRTMELRVTLDIKTQSIQCKCYNVHFCCFVLISDTADRMHKAWVSQNRVLEGATVTWWTQIHNRYCPGPHWKTRAFQKSRIFGIEPRGSF